MSKIILITGASRGIGRATAILAGQQGYCIGVNYNHDDNAANETVQAVQSAGGQAVAIQGDVTIEGDVIHLFDATEQAFGLLDGFVNNAGVVAPASTLADMEVARMEHLFRVNILGAFICAREAARRMSTARGGKGGAIVNVSSIAPRLGSPFEYIDYAASKGALDVMTNGLAKELAKEGVRVNAVRPGLIETDIHASGGQPDRAQQLSSQVPMGRPGTPEEIAETIIWLLGEQSSYVTGALLDVGGGR